MLKNRLRKQDKRAGTEASNAILRRIGGQDPYADSRPQEVEQRLRNMSYGATNSRISKLRQDSEVPVTG